MSQIWTTREVFGRFNIEEVPVTYTMATATCGAGTLAMEPIVSGPG